MSEGRERLIALVEGLAAQRFPDDPDKAWAWRDGYLSAFEDGKQVYVERAMARPRDQDWIFVCPPLGQEG